jgi:hypothetical protein
MLNLVIPIFNSSKNTLISNHLKKIETKNKNEDCFISSNVNNQLVFILIIYYQIVK